MKRVCDVVVLSDLHLGTPHCRAAALLAYISSIQPKMVVLAGDVIDIACHKPNYWPELHMRITRKLLKFTVRGIPVYYVTGNHDSFLRACSGLELGPLHVVDRVVLEQGGRRYLVVHGDLFDKHHRWGGWLVHKLGGWIYDGSMLLTRKVNVFRDVCGLPPVALATAMKRRLGHARAYMERFRQRAATYAQEHGFDGLICGHIHDPGDEIIPVDGGQGVHYLNCGDWVEHCSALECVGGVWRQVRWCEGAIRPAVGHEDVEAALGDPCRIISAA